MVDDTNEKKKETEQSGDVIMDEAETTTKEKGEQEEKKLTVEERLKGNVRLIEYAVKQKEPRLISSRLLRQTHGLRKEFTAKALMRFVDSYVLNGEEMKEALREFVKGQGDADHDGSRETGDVMETDMGEEKMNKMVETEIYAYLVVCMYLVDQKEWAKVLEVSKFAVGKISSYNVRTADPLAAQVYSYMSLAAEKMGVLSQIRGMLLQLHRAAVLRHDAVGQETLLNLLLRNYLAYNLYSQAEALRAKAQPEFYRSSAQHCRLLYYHGRIQAVLLEYTDAKEALVQASRKAPHFARGFRLQVAKWLVVVRLLLGEVPNRSELAPSADLRYMMQAYFDLARAVGLGDVNAFDEVAAKHKTAYEADGLRHVVARLRANVIRAGVRRIATAYSCISLSDVAAKLGLSSASDAEYIVAKAIRDGGISAVLDHEKGTMTCSPQLDIYSTKEPVDAFHARIAFCLDVYNESLKAIRHESKAQKKWDDANALRERQEQELQAALEDEFDF